MIVKLNPGEVRKALAQYIESKGFKVKQRGMNGFYPIDSDRNFIADDEKRGWAGPVCIRTDCGWAGEVTSAEIDCEEPADAPDNSSPYRMPAK